MNIILVHGAWADGSSWSKVIPLLRGDGHLVTAIQLPLSSLADDAAAAKRALTLVDGPTILVGHSYGGAVISEMGNDSKVKGLVYVAAFAPDIGESAFSVGKTVPPSPAQEEMKPDSDGFLKLTSKGILEDFAQDLSEADKQVMIATQGPTSVHALGASLSSAAWRSKPSWYVRASEDRTIPPELQTKMATRAGAKMIELSSSHVAMLAFPTEVARFVNEIARSLES